MLYTEFYPQPGKVTCVQIGGKPERIGLRHPVAVGLCGDAKATLRALLPRDDDRAFLERAQDGMRDWCPTRRPCRHHTGPGARTAAHRRSVARPSTAGRT
jgi:thiamine pyrophosphate-dependent acetolactate synthase large subunit-like protein